jgi:hypothetical protein
MAISDTPTLMMRDMSQSTLTKIDAREGVNGVESGARTDGIGTGCPFEIATRVREISSKVEAEVSTGSGWSFFMLSRMNLVIDLSVSRPKRCTRKYEAHQTHAVEIAENSAALIHQR